MSARHSAAPARRRPMESHAVQSARASAPRPNQSVRQPYSERKNPNVVTDVPAHDASDNNFSWNRAAARQCSGAQYTVQQICYERDYFTAFGAEVVCGTFNYMKPAWGPAPRHSSSGIVLLDRITKEIEPLMKDKQDDLQEVLQLTSIKYTQLQQCQRPDLSQRPPPANRDTYVPADNFESFEASVGSKTKKYVQAPSDYGGWFAEILPAGWLKFNLVLTFKVVFEEDDTGDDAEYFVRLEYGKRGKACLIASDGPREHVIKLTVGDYSTMTGVYQPRQFDDMDYACLKDERLMTKIFDEKVWPKGSERPAEGAEDADDEWDDNNEARGRYTLVVKEDKLCCMEPDKTGKKGAVPTIMANFSIDKVLALLQFNEADELPMIKLLCTHRMGRPHNDTENIVYIKSDSPDRAPSLKNATLLQVEVVLTLASLKNQSDVNAAFMDTHVKLQCTSLTPEQLRCWVAELEQPLPSSVIVRWGMQPDGWWVLSNVAFKDGMMDTVDASGHVVVPKHFQKNPILPMLTTDFPKINIIPFAHIRYVIGFCMWNRLYPQFFQNNEWPAKAVFALTVLGLHADKCWAGQSGVGHGAAVGWIWSREHGTGKTEAMLTCYDLQGYTQRGIYSGDTSQPLLQEACFIDANLTKFIDDVVPVEKAPGEMSSRKTAQQVRCIYDRASRAVSGKIRLPYST